MDITYLGDNISDLRKSAGISQEEFADRLKVSRQAVSKWERNEAYPDTENLIAIAKFFNVSIDDLINKDLTSAYIEKKTKMSSRLNAKK
ncbi:MAG: helix-turn-helix transcriptional regulator [Clostridia bacterium]|nr:helix-turn-helix transcriptional regulator [Clostridia bacterium]